MEQDAYTKALREMPVTLYYSTSYRKLRPDNVIHDDPGLHVDRDISDFKNHQCRLNRPYEARGILLIKCLPLYVILINLNSEKR